MATLFRWIFRFFLLKADYALFNRFFSSGQRAGAAGRVRQRPSRPV